MTDRLFSRDLVLTVGTRRIRMRSLDSQGRPRSVLRVQFKVTRTSSKEPNEAAVSIYNLAPETRVALQEKDILTQIECGYADNVHQIFLGRLDYARSFREGADWVTSFQSTDGGRAFRKSRINLSLKGPVKPERVLDEIGKSMDLDLGNLKQKVAEGGPRKAVKSFLGGFVASGKAEAELTKITNTMGLQWSVQDEQLNVLAPDETLGTLARVLSPATGLIGSPEPGDKGRITARCLILPNLIPNSRVKIEAREIEGFYKVEKVTYTGDTWGNDWYSDLELRPIE